MNGAFGPILNGLWNSLLPEPEHILAHPQPLARAGALCASKPSQQGLVPVMSGFGACGVRDGSGNKPP